MVMMPVMPPVMVVAVVVADTMQMATMPVAAAMMSNRLNEAGLDRSVELSRQRCSLSCEGGCCQRERSTDQRGNERTFHLFLLCAV